MQDPALIQATKPGYKTSELYLAIVAMILTFLAMKGIISAADVNPLMQGFTLLYAGGVGALTIYGIAHKYISSRQAIKSQSISLIQSTSVANAQTTGV